MSKQLKIELETEQFKLNTESRNTVSKQLKIEPETEKVKLNTESKQQKLSQIV